MMKPKFDGYAAQYDAWFMENDNLFQSELRLFQTALRRHCRQARALRRLRQRLFEA
ncbi:MAG: hypothetical protein ACLTG4_07640 [Oscillospiraceae bacterium]